MAIKRGTYVKTKSGTVSNVAKDLIAFGFEPTDVAVADRVFISPTGGALRLTWDHPDANPPTTSVGIYLPSGAYPVFELVGNADIRALQMIRDGSGDAQVTVTVEQD